MEQTINTNKTNSNQTEYINDLETIIGRISKNIDEAAIREEERRRVTKERFNIFTCLTKHHKEELHSNILFYLLNPEESHDCSTTFLSCFLKVLLTNPDIEDNIRDIIISEINKFKVYREQFIGRSAQTTNYGFIDLIIESPNLIIAIENKIWSTEQPDQIKRYLNYLKNRKSNFLLLYLTPFGINSVQNPEEKYIPISYEKDIMNWLELCLKETWKYPVILGGLSNYLLTIQTSILNKKSSIMNNEIQEILLKKENVILLKYLDDIFNSVTTIRNKLRNDFILQLDQELSRQGIDLKVSGDYFKNDIWSQQWRGFYCSDKDLILSIQDDIEISLEIEHDWKELYYGLTVSNVKVNKMGDPVDASTIELVKKLEEFMNKNLVKPTGKIDNRWFSWYSFKVAPENLYFDDDRLNYKFATQSNLIVQDFVSQFMEFVDVWRTCVRIYTTEKAV